MVVVVVVVGHYQVQYDAKIQSRIILGTGDWLAFLSSSLIVCKGNQLTNEKPAFSKVAIGSQTLLFF